MTVVDELLNSGMPGNDTHAIFERNWTVEQQLEVVALCGTYSTVSFVAKKAGLKNEPFAASFPAN